VPSTRPTDRCTGSTTCRGPISTATRLGKICKGLFGSTTAANVLTLGAAVQAGFRSTPPPWNAIGSTASPSSRTRRLPVRPPVGGRPRIERGQLETHARDLTSDPAARRRPRRLPGRRLRRAIPSKIEEVRGVEQRAPPVTGVDVRRRPPPPKLMAYKDEYEVVWRCPESQAQYQWSAGPTRRHRSPPPADARSFGLDDQVPSHRRPVIQGAVDEARRGTLADPFRWAEVRRQRAMIPSTRRHRHADEGLRPENLDEAVRSTRCPIRSAATSTSSRRAKHYRTEPTA
jgi:hypothetical protein